MNRTQLLILTSGFLLASLLVTDNTDASVQNRFGSAQLPSTQTFRVENGQATPCAVDAVQLLDGEQRLDGDRSLALRWQVGQPLLLERIDPCGARWFDADAVAVVSFQVCTTDLRVPIQFENEFETSIVGLDGLALAETGSAVARGRSAGSSRSSHWFPPFALLATASLLLCFVAGELVKKQVASATPTNARGEPSLPHAIAKLILRHAPKFLQPHEAIGAATSLGMTSEEAATELTLAERTQSRRGA